jgi:hypothetical protein
MAAVRHPRSRLVAGLVALLLLVGAAFAPAGAAAAAPTDIRLRAVLDGKPIPVGDVGEYFCHDFSFPEIQCFSSPQGLDTTMASGQMQAMTAGTTYVTIYDFAYYGGSYMHVSEDYGALSWIGWNDKVSSYIARNWETGQFYTDWFYGGTQWNFCCNSSVSDLGGYSNTFSSVRRT